MIEYFSFLSDQDAIMVHLKNIREHLDNGFLRLKLMEYHALPHVIWSREEVYYHDTE